MNFFLDANMPLSAKGVLEKYGEVKHAFEVGLGAVSDQAIAEYSIKHRAILVTQDLDFGNPHVFPKGTLYGLVIVRPTIFSSAEEIRGLLSWLMRSISPVEFRGAVTVVDPVKIRRRDIEA